MTGPVLLEPCPICPLCRADASWETALTANVGGKEIVYGSCSECTCQAEYHDWLNYPRAVDVDAAALAEHFATGVRGLYDQAAGGVPVQSYVGTNCVCGWTTAATDEQAVRQQWAAHVIAAFETPSAPVDATQHMREALETISDVYDKWDSVSEYAVTALFRMSKIAKKALAALTPSEMSQ